MSVGIRIGGHKESALVRGLFLLSTLLAGVSSALRRSPVASTCHLLQRRSCSMSTSSRPSGPASLPRASHFNLRLPAGFDRYTCRHRMQRLSFLWRLTLSVAILVSLAQATYVNESLAGEIHATFDLVDTHATEKGGRGSVIVRIVPGPYQFAHSFEITKIQVMGLDPTGTYEFHFTFSTPGPFAPANIFTAGVSNPLNPNHGGHLKENHQYIFAPPFPAGTDIRLDVFVTRTHPTVSGSTPEGQLISSYLDRDPLLVTDPFATGIVFKLE